MQCDTLIFIYIVNNYRNKVSLHIHPPHSYKIFCVWLELTKPSLSNFQIHNTILQIKDTMLYITSSGLIHLSSILQPLNNYCTAFCHSRILFSLQFYINRIIQYILFLSGFFNRHRSIQVIYFFSWMNFDSLCLSRNISILSKLSNLSVYKQQA